MSPGPFEIRAVQPDASEPTLRLIYDPPGPEATGVVGSEERARAVSECLLRAGLLVPRESEAFGAFVGGAPVGVLVGDHGGKRREPEQGWLTLLRDLLSVVPARELPGLVRRAFLRSRLEFPADPEAYHVTELHVAPSHRGRGIGAALLGQAEERARKLACPHLCLTTLMSNPARRLYERQGYRVSASRRVLGYRAITGADGRVQMRKPLTHP